MSRSTPTALGRDLVTFFEDFLPAQRGLSPHTIRSYRDALLLFLRFTARELRRTVDRLDVPDLTVERVTRFLASLEAERRNGIATRNARLGAIHVFARYLAGQRPEHLGILQRIIGMPFKRGAVEAPIEYLDRAELDALLKSIDRSTDLGRRDYALFAFMFNTGARVQEALDVRVADVRLEAPPQVRLLGKGRKVRICPLWPATARLLRDLIAERAALATRRTRRSSSRTPVGSHDALRRALPPAPVRAEGVASSAVPRRTRSSTRTRSATARRWRCSSPA